MGAKLAIILLILLAFGGGALLLKHSSKEKVSVPEASTGASSSLTGMKLESSAFADSQLMPMIYTCDGKNMNPPLSFTGVPAGAKSLALIMEDPDVPRNLKPDGMWNHWVIFNMPPATAGILEGSMPPGITGRNSGSKNSYQGPCPPDREHRYFFKLFALDSMIQLDSLAGKEEVERAMAGHVLAEAELIGRYRRR